MANDVKAVFGGEERACGGFRGGRASSVLFSSECSFVELFFVFSIWLRAMYVPV